MRRLILLATCLVGLTAPVRASWTLAVLPDTQNYRTPETAPVFEAQTQWIVDNKDALSIEMVLHDGDSTNNNLPEQWGFAKNAMSILDGQVPYMLAVGNHDYFPSSGGWDESMRSQTLVNDFFSLSDNSLNATTVEMTPGKLESTYRTFTAPDGRKILILKVEYLPRPEVIEWAGSIADLYPDHTAIVLVHSNIKESWAVHGEPTSVHDAPFLWNNLTSQHENIELVLSGHYHTDVNDTDPNGELTTARLESVGVNGNTIHEIAFNSQDQPNGGNGFLRLYEFMDDGATVQARTYSPTLDLWLTNKRNEFQFELTALGDIDDDGDADGDDFLLWQQGDFTETDLANWESYYDIAGDFDFDGDVDGADFLLWQRTYPPVSLSASELADWDVDYGTVGVVADFDHDGDTDGFDFLAWQRGDTPNAVQNPPSASTLAAWKANYGAGVEPLSAASTTVPEPTTAIMLMLAMAAMLTAEHREPFKAVARVSPIQR